MKVSAINFIRSNKSAQVVLTYIGLILFTALIGKIFVDSDGRHGLYNFHGEFSADHLLLGFSRNLGTDYLLRRNSFH